MSQLHVFVTTHYLTLAKNGLFVPHIQYVFDINIEETRTFSVHENEASLQLIVKYLFYINI